MDFKKLTNRAKSIVDKRGGTDALKEDLNELKDIAKGEGTMKDKAKAAADALKDPGQKGEDAAPAGEPAAADPAAAESPAAAEESPAAAEEPPAAAEEPPAPAPPTGSAPQPPQGT